MQGAPLSDKQFALPECTQFDLNDSAEAVTYRIFVRRPPSSPPATGWPVLYLLDGNATFATAVDAMRAQAPWPLGTGIREAVIVAIGYPTEAAYDSLRRSWDYSPPPGATYPPFVEGGPPVRTGGVEHFLTFIEAVLKPEMTHRLPVDRDRQAFFGHSFGGLCVLRALFTRPNAFSHWIAASPALWWEKGAILRDEAAYASRAERPDARILISVGAYEQALAPFQIGAEDEAKRREAFAESRMVDNARELAERLAKLPGVSSHFRLIADETHMSVLPTAINQAIRFAFGIWS